MDPRILFVKAAVVIYNFRNETYYSAKRVTLKTQTSPEAKAALAGMLVIQEPCLRIHTIEQCLRLFSFYHNKTPASITFTKILHFINHLQISKKSLHKFYILKTCIF